MMHTDPFLTGSYKSEPSLPNCCNYRTEYDTNFPLRPFSPRVGPLRRPTNIKLNPGVMDILSEQKTQFRPFPADIISRARPPMVKKPNNLFLTGDIELFPEYRSAFVPYSLDSIYKSNKTSCFHPKREKKIVKKVPVPSVQVAPPQQDNRPDVADLPEMPQNRKPIEAKICNNNYGVSCMNRYHEKLDTENNYVPEYRSKYKPVIAERSSIIPQQSHFVKYEDEFAATSEYNNRYKTYDHFAKSAPIKKGDNLSMKGSTYMHPEYAERYKKVDINTFERRQPYRQQDNLHQFDALQSNGHFGRQQPEYYEKFKDHQIRTLPERAKPKNDFLNIGNQHEFVKLPQNVRLSSNRDSERNLKQQNIDLPIDVPSYRDDGSARRKLSRTYSEEEEIPIHSRPEYRRAMRNYMIKERSPSRGPPEPVIVKPDSDDENNNKVVADSTKTVDHNNVTKILMDNKVNVPELPMVDENNEVIIEPLQKPSNFKIPTRSPITHSPGKGPSYPIPKDYRYHERPSSRGPPQQPEIPQYRDSGGKKKTNFKLTVEHFDDNRGRYDAERERQEIIPPYEQQQRRCSPKFGRRAPNPVEDYKIRTRTNVIEGNPNYIREQRKDIHPNRHQQSAYYHQSNEHQIPMAPHPADSLASNYRSNFETEKQMSYRQSLANESSPFVVLDQQTARTNATVKPNSWMRKQWYDTN